MRRAPWRNGSAMASSKRSYVFRLDSDPVCYLWTGHGPLDTPADAVDPSGASWLGAGGLISLPALKALINGVAERIQITLSGVTAHTLRLAMEDKDTVYRAEARIGYVEFDLDWQVAGPVTWEWLGIADMMTIENRESDSGRTRSIYLSIAGADTLRSNPAFTFWTDASQRLRSPDDAFCDHVAMINASVTRRFGPK